MIGKRTVLGIKIESTYNTDAVPVAATDAVLVDNPQYQLDGRMYDRIPVKNTLGALPGLYGGALMTITFDADVKGSGVAGTAGELGPALRACGLQETVVPATSVTYAPRSSGHESVTIYMWQDGLLYKMTGARGKVTAALKTGEPGKLSFSFMGHFTGPTDVALPAPTYDAAVPVALLGLSGFLVDSYAATVSSIAFDMGTEIGTPDDISAADGYDEVTITGRRVTGSIDPLLKTVATYDWVGKWQAAGAAALATGTVGASAGNIFALSMPKVQYSAVGPSERSGVLAREVAFLAAENTGDDELSLAFT